MSIKSITMMICVVVISTMSVVAMAGNAVTVDAIVYLQEGGTPKGSSWQIAVLAESETILTFYCEALNMAGFTVWEIGIDAIEELLPMGISLPVKTQTPGRKCITLKRGVELLQWGREYGVALSYDAEANEVSCAIQDLADNKSVFSTYYEVSGVDRPIDGRLLTEGSIAQLFMGCDRSYRQMGLPLQWFYDPPQLNGVVRLNEGNGAILLTADQLIPYVDIQLKGQGGVLVNTTVAGFVGVKTIFFEGSMQGLEKWSLHVYARPEDNKNVRLALSSIDLTVEDGGFVQEVTYSNPLPVGIRDPYIIEYNGTYYMYGTTSDIGFHAYYSQNLIDWKGPILVYSTQDKLDFWAPEVVQIDERFYLFGGRPIRVAVSDHPLGPFKDGPNNPITPEGWSTLDPHVYTSKDGRNYLLYTHEWTQIFWGKIYIQELTEDLLALQGQPQLLFDARDATWTAGDLGRVMEAPTLIIYDGQYYLMYSSFKGNDYGVGYATAVHLLGPYSDKGQIITNDSGHNSVIVGPDGNLYTAYHSPNARPPFKLHIDRLWIDEDGQLHVDQTSGQKRLIRWTEPEVQW